jgi:WD40 repeat protein
MTGTPLAVLQGHTDEVNWATFTFDSKSILSAGTDRTVRRWLVDSDDLNQFVLDELNRLKINTTSD